MEVANTIAALFDFDGVIMDTESQYTVFWNEQGSKYLHLDNFGAGIKGQTLTQIYDKYFHRMPDVQEQITCELNRFERNMSYEYLPGVRKFLADLHRHGVKIALVTSSNEEKMKNVYYAHPEFKAQFDCILTGEMFERSKPEPDCYLLGMEIFDVTRANSFVFEDSFHGLQAGRSSGATVIGLATTNTREAIAPKSDLVIDDFDGMTYGKMLEVRR